MHNSKLKGNLILLITAIVWGISFISQSTSMDHIKPSTFNGIRTMLGAIVLIPFVVSANLKNKKNNIKQTNADKKVLIIGGILCGTALCIASTLQTYSMIGISGGKAAFLTANYIIFVPIISIFIGKRPPLKIIPVLIISMVGFYFLCMTKDDLSVNSVISFAGNLINGFINSINWAIGVINKIPGVNITKLQTVNLPMLANGGTLGLYDAVALICAVIFSLHILLVDYFSPKVEGVKLACLQFFVCGLINIIIMLVFEKPNIDQIMKCWFPIFYAGVFSCGVAYTLQIVGQKYTDPTSATLIMSLESVFAAIFGWLLPPYIPEDIMNGREIFGCLLIFIAIILIQLPSRKKKFE